MLRPRSWRLPPPRKTFRTEHSKFITMPVPASYVKSRNARVDEQILAPTVRRTSPETIDAAQIRKT